MHCADVDECERGLSMCNGTCINTIGSYNCFCPVGFAYNSATDTCWGKYTLSLRWYDVHCYEFESSSRNISDLDECQLELHDCSIDASCTNTHGGYECHCDEGYYGDGRKCFSKLFLSNDRKIPGCA